LTATHRSIALISSPLTGDWLPTTCSVNSMVNASDSSPSTCEIRARAACSPRPGGTRQSTRTWARDGITLILPEALAIVGVRVTPNIGSIRVRSRGSAAAIRARAAPGSAGSSPRPRSRAAEASVTVNDSGWSASRARIGASLSSALSPVRGSDAWPAAPWAVTLKRKIPFSAQHTP